MDVADTRVAAAVEQPASTRTADGSEEPEPDPRSGVKLFMLYGVEIFCSFQV